MSELAGNGHLGRLAASRFRSRGDEVTAPAYVTAKQPSARVSAALALAVLKAAPELRAKLFSTLEPVTLFGVETWLRLNEIKETYAPSPAPREHMA